jgi:hypothetical protein
VRFGQRYYLISAKFAIEPIDIYWLQMGSIKNRKNFVEAGERKMATLSDYKGKSTTA